MPKLEVHTDDLPSWAVRKQKLPETYLGFLREEVFPSPDGKTMLSFEDKMLRQHWDGMLAFNATARDYLLRKVMEENAALLAAAPEQPRVTIDAIHSFQPLGPVLQILGCATVTDPDEGSDEPSRTTLVPWFLEKLRERCRPDRLSPVLAWQDDGGQQAPRTDPDGHD